MTDRSIHSYLEVVGVLIIFPSGKWNVKTESILSKGRLLSQTGVSVLYVIPPAKELIDNFKEGEQFTTINFYPLFGFWTSQILVPLLTGIDEVIVFRRCHRRIARRAIRAVSHQVTLSLQHI